MISNWRYLVAIIGIAAVAAIAFSKMHMASPPAELDLARSKPSEKGIFAVSIELEAGGDVKQGELHNWIVAVKTPDSKAVDGAKITVDGGMPQHGHGLPTAPQMTGELGEGRYRVEGVKFNMGGWWELKFAISAPQGDDRVVFNLVL